ncbi:MAG TPA: hypothetical protein VIY86_13280, partial [Pirellulaceae bacterium]
MSASATTMSRKSSPRLAWDIEHIRFAADNRDALREAVRACANDLAGVSADHWPQFVIAHHGLRPEGQFRLALVAAGPADLAAKLAGIQTRLAEPDRLRLRDASGIFFESSPLALEGSL